MIIRPEKSSDIDDIRSITQAAFLNADHSQQTEAMIIDILRYEKFLYLSLVATDHDKIVGNICFSPVFLDGKDKGWLGLGPISVHPSHQRRGIGSKLIVSGLDRIRKAGKQGCVLLGDPSFYGRFGFKTGSGLIMQDVPIEYFQALSFSDNIPSGNIVEYHPIFLSA